ncbi:MAG: glycosyltransferase family 4 protein [Pseudomonadota bacterium]
MINILVFSTLYPNASMPAHGVFVENRLRNLLSSGEVTAHVIAPVPWFPFNSRRFGSYAQFARVPMREVRHGLTIEHPRYLVTPKIGWTFTPNAIYRAGLKTVRALMAEGKSFDMIDAHYFYPDGVAAVRLANTFDLPVTVTARGTDINLIPQTPRARAQLVEASRGASHMIAVCQALKDTMIEIGMDGDKITVLRNGVDLELFTPQDRKMARKTYGITKKAVVSVGGLIQRKAHDIAIRAVAEMPDTELLIAGKGEEEGALKTLVRTLGVKDRVRFLGLIPHEQLPVLYSAADIMSLTSSREGWANVLLEAMACGTPVVASSVWGTPEVVAAPEAGRLMRDRTPRAFVEAAQNLLNDYPNRAATRRYAERFSWDETTQGQLELFRRLTGKS